jgi:hypothetical protein
VVTGPSCPAPCLSLHTYWKKRFPPFIESYTAWLADLLEPTRVSFERAFLRRRAYLSAGERRSNISAPKKADLFQSSLCHIDGGIWHAQKL